MVEKKEEKEYAKKTHATTLHEVNWGEKSFLWSVIELLQMHYVVITNSLQ